MSHSHAPTPTPAAEGAAPTPVERSYLEIIAYLAERREPVIAAQLARWLHVRPPTVTSTLHRLEQKGLVAREASGALHLTPDGTTLAAQIIRRHRLLECFLYNVLQVPWHAIHREASQLEPALSPLLEAHMNALIGHATVCPHGNPIPGHETAAQQDIRLSTAPAGAHFVITRIDEEAGEDSCSLQLLWTRRLLPGTSLVRLPDPRDGIAVRRADHRIVLSRRLAGLVWGTCAPQPSPDQPA
ncbi:MAG: hypothetical protein RLZZ387_4180 [Chloroflexota bacterium]